jgi:hypothetical protein
MPKLGTMRLNGASGKTYELEIFPRADLFKPLGAVYFLAKRIPFAEGEAEYTWIYVGQSEDISRRPFDESPKACIDEHEANCVCLLIEPDRATRLAIATDLAGAYAPPCNPATPNR